jgi:uracil phosphoribosyltransferase
MNFTTKIPISKSVHPIDYHSKIISLGSCFAVNMAEKFDYFKFENTCNPFGIVFNPVSIEKLVYRITRQLFYKENDIFFHNESWHCYEVHSELSKSNKVAFLNSLNGIIEQANRQISDASHLIITLGTSWVYRNIETNEIVANCHKVPQKQFKKELLSVEIIEQSIQKSIALIHNINPNAIFIFTVSPVRHIKDGFVENQVSKAHLIAALQTAIRHLPSATYFPSYEIMMDELRDYRFYAEDMLHPSRVAIDYIWERFKETSISETAFSIMDEVETIQKGLAHRPFNANSESHQQFSSKLRDRIAVIQKQFPGIKFNNT